MKLLEKTFEIGNKIEVITVFGSYTLTVDRVTKTQAICYNQNGTPIKFRRNYRMWENSSCDAHVTAIPYEPWETRKFKVY